MRRPSVIFLLALIIGVKLGDWSIYSSLWLCLIAFLIMSSFILQYDPKKWLYLILGVSISLTHTSIIEKNLEQQNTLVNHLVSEKGKVTLEGTFYQKNLLDQKQCWLHLNSGGIVRLQFSNYKTFPTLVSGTHVQVSGKFLEATPPRNPNGFDEKKWLKTKKAFGTLYIDYIEKTSGKDDSLEMLRHHLIKPVVETLLYHTALKQGPLATGMLFGEDGWIEESVTDAFSVAGVNHILSVSGAHFAVLLFWIYYLLNMRETTFWFRKVLVWLTLGTFIWLIGMDVAALRAFLMFIILDLMKLSYKESDGLNGLCLTVSLLIILNPYTLVDIGLQLAASAMYGIIVIAPFIEDLGFKKMELILTPKPDCSPLKKWLFKQLRLLVVGINTSISVSIVLYPILRNQFNQFSFLSILYNIPVSIISAISLPASVLCCLLAPFPFLAKAVGIVNGVLLKGLTLLVETSLILPHDSGLTTLSQQQTLLYVGILLLPIYFKTFFKGIEVFTHLNKEVQLKRMLTALGTMGIWVILVCLPTLPSSNHLRVYYLDVGQGDGSVIITPEQKVILIDTGLKKGRLTMKNSLLKLGIDHVDWMVLSHPHDDHIGGAEDILNTMSVKHIALFNGSYSTEEQAALKTLINIGHSKGSSIHYWEKGDQQRLNVEADPIILNVLHPPQGYDAASANDESLVCEIIYKKSSFLFTGDISRSVEYDIIEQVKGDGLIMKVPHHGSGSSSDDTLLSLSINLGVIQVGQNNRYGHPNDQALNRYAKHNIPILRTDEKGCILLRTDGEKIYVKSQL